MLNDGVTKKDHDISDKKKIIGQIVKNIVKAANPLRVLAYGSWGRGNPGVNSDIDLLIIISEENKQKYIASKQKDFIISMDYILKDEIESIFNQHVDVLVVTPSEIKKSAHIKGTFLRTALLDSLLLYESDDALEDLDSWQTKECSAEETNKSTDYWLKWGKNGLIIAENMVKEIAESSSSNLKEIESMINTDIIFMCRRSIKGLLQALLIMNDIEIRGKCRPIDLFLMLPEQLAINCSEEDLIWLQDIYLQCKYSSNFEPTQEEVDKALALAKNIWVKSTVGVIPQNGIGCREHD